MNRERPMAGAEMLHASPADMLKSSVQAHKEHPAVALEKKPDTKNEVDVREFYLRSLPLWKQMRHGLRELFENIGKKA